MYRVLVFAGTTEGYDITEFLSSHGVGVHMCAATEYGSQRFEESEYLTVSHDRMDRKEMERFMRRGSFDRVIDATHPYAVEVTENIRGACEAVHLPCMRVLRESLAGSADGDVVAVDSLDEAIAYLEGTVGNILVTTGSKELAKFTGLADYAERVYARVLSLPAVVQQCAGLGFQGQHLICMQGPFSKELNVAMLRQYDCRYLVTKEAGKNGGFEEKCEAAREAGATLVVIGRPSAERGMSLEECRRQLCALYGIRIKPQVALVGIGMGSRESMTVEAREACRKAQCIIGGRRLADAVAEKGQAVCYEYDPEKIRRYIEEHPEYERFVVALSGDVGFYSGAKRLLRVLGEDTRVICGVSSAAYFMSRIRLSWDDAALVSAHGRNCNLIHYIKTNKKTFAILGTRDGVAALAAKLCGYGMDHVTMYVGEELSYPRERICSGAPAEFLEYEGSALSVVCVTNPKAAPAPMHLPDASFIRGKAPMTKEFVRSLSVDKLELTPDAVCWDVGAGTGSVSAEMALQAYDGKVFAIERKEDALELLRRNRQALALDNLEIVAGCAPDALKDLEAPSHVFIGGSSGNLREIADAILRKNPCVRLVINCITLETLAETLDIVKTMPFADVDIAQVTVARSKELGRYHMMMGENPIYIITCKGGAADASHT